MHSFSNGLPAGAILSGITSAPNGDIFFTETSPSANAIGMLNPANTGQGIQNFGDLGRHDREFKPDGDRVCRR